MLSLYINQHKYHLLLSEVLLTGACMFDFARPKRDISAHAAPGIKKSNKNGASLNPMQRSFVAVINKAGRKDVENKY